MYVALSTQRSALVMYAAAIIKHAAAFVMYVALLTQHQSAVYVMDTLSEELNWT